MRFEGDESPGRRYSTFYIPYKLIFRHRFQWCAYHDLLNGLQIQWDNYWSIGSMPVNSTSPWANSDWRSLKVINIFLFVGIIPLLVGICLGNICYHSYVFSKTSSHALTSDRSDGMSLLLFCVQIEFHHGN